MRETQDDRARRQALQRIGQASDRANLEKAAASGDRAAQKALRKLIRQETRSRQGKR